MAFISYAQNFEDVLLWRALKHVKNGFYIDIGANDPVVDSVSLAFYERGWRGIHVEPIPFYADKLGAARPDEVVMRVAVGVETTESIRFFTFPGTGLSTAVPAIAQQHKENGFKCVTAHVSTISLDDILSRCGSRSINWMKLDVEGFEQNVLESWKRSNTRPWVLVIESVLPKTCEPAWQDWEHLVVSLGYEFVYFDGLNRFYVHADHEELKPAFHYGPSVFDNFVPFRESMRDRVAVLKARYKYLNGTAKVIALCESAVWKGILFVKLALEFFRIKSLPKKKQERGKDRKNQSGHEKR